jgi:hypothetical protein
LTNVHLHSLEGRLGEILGSSGVKEKKLWLKEKVWVSYQGLGIVGATFQASRIVHNNTLVLIGKVSVGAYASMPSN